MLSGSLGYFATTLAAVTTNVSPCFSLCTSDARPTMRWKSSSRSIRKVFDLTCRVATEPTVIPSSAELPATRNCSKERHSGPGTRAGNQLATTVVLEIIGTINVSYKQNRVVPTKTQRISRSEERRVGKECRSRRSPYHSQK